MPVITLKKTKQKPVPGFDHSTGKVGYKYLYTDTGNATSWGIAMKFVFEKGDPVPDKIAVEIRRAEGEAK